MKHNKRIRCVVLLGLGLGLFLFWGYSSLLLNLQPTSDMPSNLVFGAIGKFLLFPLAISLFSYVFWMLLLQIKPFTSPTTKIRRVLILIGLIIPIAYLLSIPCLFFLTPFQEFFMTIFPFLDRLLYAPPGICIIAIDMLPLAIAFETHDKVR